MTTDKRRLCIHHIGGRNGLGVFPQLPAFAQDITNVLYDADPDCIEQIELASKHLVEQTNVFPYCIGESNKKCDFYINYDPYTSSRLKFNRELSSFYQRDIHQDYVYAESCRSVERRELDLVSLDSLMNEKRIDALPPDFLSVDTQGTEYEVFLGAKDTLRDHVLAVSCEAEFYPMYVGQKLFGDVLNLLTGEGFKFVGFLGVGQAPPYRTPVGLRGKGFALWSDILLFKDLDRLATVDAATSFTALRKMAMIAIVYNQFEYALEALRRSAELPGATAFAANANELAYGAFLNQLQDEVGKVELSFPETFAQKFTFEQSRQRFDVKPDETAPVIPAAPSIKAPPTANGAPGVLQRAKELVTSLSRSRRQSLPGLAALPERAYSGVEELLCAHGLRAQADMLKEHRLQETPFAKSAPRVPDKQLAAQ